LLRRTPATDLSQPTELREDESMWRRLALMLYLAGVVATPVFGQATGSPIEQKLRLEIEGVFTSWLDTLNRGDGKAAAAFFAPGAPALNPAGVFAGNSQDYVNRIEGQHQRNAKTTATVERVQAIGGDAAYATGSYTNTFGPNNQFQTQGNWLQLFERRDDAWKIGASSFSQVGPVKNLGK
jgi:ketosteroid isomerase-like protein